MQTVHHAHHATDPSHERYLALLDAAKARARELHGQALDGLWSDAEALARRSLRSATRFAQRATRHALLRRTGSGAGST